LAFIHDFSQYEASIGVDLAAIDAFGDALRDSGKPFVIASGVAAERKGDLATEDDPPHPLFPRATAARTTLALADRGVRSSVVRLPPSVHGRGDKGFVPTLVETARLRGSSGYVGEGMNRWPAVHREDAARLFGIAVERAAPGSVLHAVGDEGIPTRSIAEVIGRHLALPAVSVPAQEVGEHFGWIGGFFSLDVAASNELTRARFGWQPTGPGLIADLDEGHYFEPPA
ncbi:MAG TPA: hypothetical protein VGS21_04070, partial [Acidimicrobiales bacterium]|nr:hypothetical protein [Acidimicrobiales bacterium]